MDRKGRKEYINMIKVCQQWDRSDYFLYSHTAVLLFLNFKKKILSEEMSHRPTQLWCPACCWTEGRYRAMEPKGRIFLLPPPRDQRKCHEGGCIWNGFLGKKGNWDGEKAEMKAWRQRAPRLGKDVPFLRQEQANAKISRKSSCSAEVLKGWPSAHNSPVAFYLVNTVITYF